jgi:uncharacterized protein with HEPN domain
MRRDDEIRLHHMLQAAREAISFAKGKSRSDLDIDRMLTLSLVKELELIGEAATKVSEETQHQFTDIPWAEIVGMRNRLIHTYFDINLDIVWQTVVQDLPPLLSSLENILPDST